MKTLIAILLCALSLPASATLTCYLEDLGTNITWNVGQKFYGAWTTPLYCYANYAELTYIQQNFTGLHGRTGDSINGNPTVVWTDPADVDFLVNNL